MEEGGKRKEGDRDRKGEIKEEEEEEEGEERIESSFLREQLLLSKKRPIGRTNGG